MTRGADKAVKITVACFECIEDVPPDTELADWVRPVARRTGDDMFQVWCERHDVPMLHLGIDEMMATFWRAKFQG